MYNLHYVTKFKTNTRGYWKDTNNKFYKDNIIIKKCNYNQLQKYKDKLFNVEHEQTVFYTDGQRGFIEYANGKLEVLKNCNQYICKKNILKCFIELFLNQYNGCTVEILNKGFYKVIGWYK